jgi:hypothetical protein
MCCIPVDQVSKETLCEMGRKDAQDGLAPRRIEQAYIDGYYEVITKTV